MRKVLVSFAMVLAFASSASAVDLFVRFSQPQTTATGIVYTVKATDALGTKTGEAGTCDGCAAAGAVEKTATLVGVGPHEKRVEVVAQTATATATSNVLISPPLVETKAKQAGGYVAPTGFFALGLAGVFVTKAAEPGIVLDGPAVRANNPTPATLCSSGASCPLVATFKFANPTAGVKNIWGRVKYTRGASDTDANSFWLCVVTTSRTCSVFGNDKTFGSWFWDGDGSTTSLAGKPLAMTLPAGDVTLELRARESVPVGPMLEAIFVSDSATPVPTDAAFVAAFTPVVPTDTDRDGLFGVDDPCPTDARNRCFGPVAIDRTTNRAVRMNAGTSSAECSGAKTDCSGVPWVAEFGRTGGSTATCSLGGGGEGCVITGIPAVFGCDSESTEDLFQCERFGASSYSFNLANGAYLLNLYFANTFGGTAAVGSRVFDVLVEGRVALSRFDQVAAAGASGKAVVRSVPVTVSDGNGLQVSFRRIVEQPSVKAIEVLRK